uniref:Uncharacterized protein n=1 Tax=Athene cunicularia TaxID=194338 RepID=A0A663LKR9_ATHCN
MPLGRGKGTWSPNLPCSGPLTAGCLGGLCLRTSLNLFLRDLQPSCPGNAGGWIGSTAAGENSGLRKASPDVSHVCRADPYLVPLLHCRLQGAV